MKVKILIGAEAAYACISTPTTSLDVRLAAGKSTQKSLLEAAQEMRDKAARLLAQAALIEEASTRL